MDQETHEIGSVDAIAEMIARAHLGGRECPGLDKALRDARQRAQMKKASRFIKDGSFGE